MSFLAAIKHANIVSIYDFVTIGLHGYIVMEYVHGKTLEEMMEERNSPFEVQEAIRHILGILPAFTYLVNLDLVYCDFKPQNVMVETLKDGTEIVKLIDLGTVIKQVPNSTDVYGTHGFYAPEAVKMPSPETDLYTICRTLAYMVTQMDLWRNLIPVCHLQKRTKLFRDYPCSLSLAGRKGAQSKPSMRFKSVKELSDQLSGAAAKSRRNSRHASWLEVVCAGILTTTESLACVARLC